MLNFGQCNRLVDAYYPYKVRLIAMSLLYSNDGHKFEKTRKSPSKVLWESTGGAIMNLGRNPRTVDACYPFRVSLSAVSLFPKNDHKFNETRTKPRQTNVFGENN